MMDVRLIDNGEGGEFVLNGINIEMVSLIQNQVFLALFGGNPGFRTSEVATGEQRQDFWGNALIPDPSMQFNSSTEFTLRNIAIDSSSIIEIENAVEEDLKLLSDLGTFIINVTNPLLNRIKIKVAIIEPEGREAQEFSFIWDQAENELI